MQAAFTWSPYNAYDAPHVEDASDPSDAEDAVDTGDLDDGPDHDESDALEEALDGSDLPSDEAALAGDEEHDHVTSLTGHGRRRPSAKRRR